MEHEEKGDQDEDGDRRRWEAGERSEHRHVSQFAADAIRRCEQRVDRRIGVEIIDACLHRTTNRGDPLGQSLSRAGGVGFAMFILCHDSPQEGCATRPVFNPSSCDSSEVKIRPFSSVSRGEASSTGTVGARLDDPHC